jgi:hypothetical protein
MQDQDYLKVPIKRTFDPLLDSINLVPGKMVALALE